MDKRNTVIGVLLLVIGFGLLFVNNNRQSDARRLEAERLARETPAASVPSPAVPPPATAVASETAAAVSSGPGTGAGLAAQTAASEELHVLANEFLKVTFTTRGGAIKEVQLLKHAESLGSDRRYTFRASGQLPMLGLAYPSPDGKAAEFAPAYQLVNKSDHEITFSYDAGEGMKLVRSYRLDAVTEGAAPYTIVHSTRFENSSAAERTFVKLLLNVGTAPAETVADPTNSYLNFGAYDGKDVEFKNLTQFKASSGLLGMGAHPATEQFFDYSRSVVWAAVKNQFFAAVLTPEKPAIGYISRPAQLPAEGEHPALEAITGSLVFDAQPIPAGKSRSLDASLYIGPKEYNRLASIGGDKHQGQDLLMQFGWFGFVSRFTLKILHLIHSVVGNYGVSIILITLFVRLCIWPITAIATRTSKKMAKLSEPLKQLREKHKDDPARLQKEMMELYKSHGVNPAAGCLPMFIQIPIFIGFFYMLKTNSELRFESFLWIKDLSQPEHLFSWGMNLPVLGTHFNLLPLLMGVSMHYQMKATPMTTTDEMQQKIFKMFPYIFTCVSWTFASGLVIYWTVSNSFAIFQTWYMNRKPQAELELIKPDVAASTRGKGKFRKPGL